MSISFNSSPPLPGYSTTFDYESDSDVLPEDDQLREEASSLLEGEMGTHNEESFLFSVEDDTMRSEASEGLLEDGQDPFPGLAPFDDLRDFENAYPSSILDDSDE